MLENNLTKLLAFDFDEKKNKNYKTEVSFLLKTLKNFNIDYLLEISQSGTGLHV
jgi:hypothetical protein